MSTTASPRQLALIRKLVDERPGTPLLAEALEAAGVDDVSRLSGGRNGQASGLIDRLIASPRGFASSSAPASSAPAAGRPARKPASRKAPAFPPTPEQALAVERFVTGEDLIVEAGAGTGKTSTLILMAEAAADRRGQYVAFNRSIVQEAGTKMPGSVSCNTAHSLAMRAVGNRFRGRLSNSRRLRGDEIARILDIDPLSVTVGEHTKRLAPGYLAGIVIKALKRFCQTADTTPSVRHFEYIDGIDLPEGGKRTYENNDLVREELLPALEYAWRDACDPDGSLRYEHDFYLKLWQLSDPHIEADYILFDEAQDANPVMLAIVNAQRHCQRVYVGDSQQQIYEFTGAVNAMANTGIENRVFLTQSFRFGPAIADLANVVLARLEAELRLAGTASIDSSVGPLPGSAKCFLSRTNAAAVRRMLDELTAGGRPHLMGGGKDVIAFARAARDLKRGVPVSHPELACFSTWGEVVEYVDSDEQGEDLRLLVQLVDDFGADAIITALEHMPAEKDASIVVSTAHKAKGREWDTVVIAGDFPDGQKRALAGAELRLLYVAVTRAKIRVDVSLVAALREVPADGETPGMIPATSLADVLPLFPEAAAQ